MALPLDERAILLRRLRHAPRRPRAALVRPARDAAAFTLAAGSASVLFHGTQCGCWTFEPLSVPGAGWATRRVDPVFLEPSIFTNAIDVVCAVQLAIFVLACNGGLGASHWATVLVPTLGLLVSSTVLEAPAALPDLVVVHSMWHVASAYVVRRALRGEASVLKCLFVFRCWGLTGSRLRGGGDACATLWAACPFALALWFIQLPVDDFIHLRLLV